MVDGSLGRGMKKVQRIMFRWLLITADRKGTDEVPDFYIQGSPLDLLPDDLPGSVYPWVRVKLEVCANYRMLEHRTTGTNRQSGGQVLGPG